MENVYFVKLENNCSVADQVKAAEHIMENTDFDAIMKKQDKVAVKVHVGEKNNDTYVQPDIAKVVCSRIKSNDAYPFLTETSTLYKGERSNAIDHLHLAFDHGFTLKGTGAPFIMADGLVGDSEITVEIPGVLYNKVDIAREVVLADALVVITHVTGHLNASMGACIKNLGMGLASRKGKLRQHSAIKPSINTAKCTFCRQCIKWCPETAIIEKAEKAFILTNKCIGCGECLAVCKFDAVKYNWGVGSVDMQKRMAEHALGVVQHKKSKIFCFNFLVNMTKDCDCMGYKQEKIIPDVGILASADVIALDQASLDLTAEYAGTNIGRKSFPALDPEVQLAHGEAIGLGSRKYNLVQL